MTQNPKTTILTEEFLQQGLSSNGGYSRQQLSLLGVSGLRRQWEQTIIGQPFPTKAIKKFIALKDFHLLPVQDYYWTSIEQNSQMYGPTRMSMVHTQKEAEKEIRKLKKAHPERKFYWTSSDEFGENCKKGEEI